MIGYNIRGSEVHDEIKDKVDTIERETRSLSNEVYRFENSISQLQTERENAYTRLALIYLPDMTTGSVNETLSELEGTVKKIFEEKQRKRRAVEEGMKTSLEKEGELNTQLSDITKKLNDKAEQREKVETEIAAELAQDETYTGLKKQTDQAALRLKLYNVRLREVRTLADKKLPEYRNDQLFMYLLRNNYGTPKYNPQGLFSKWVRNQDENVASIVGYRAAKKNYDFLVSMPELMAIEIEKRQDELDKLVAQMREYETGKAKEKGLPTIMEEGKQYEDERARILGEIAVTKSQYKGYCQKRTELDNEKGKYHSEAIQKLKAYLKGKAIEELKIKAKDTTETHEDDKLVYRIEDINHEIRGLKKEAKRANKERDAVEDTLHGLKSILGTFEGKDYESSRSYFRDEFDVNALLAGYIAGTIKSGHITNEINSNQDFAPIVRQRSHNYPTSNTRWDNDDDDGDIFSPSRQSTWSPSKRSTYSPSTSIDTGWDFGGGGSSISIGGFGGGGGSTSVGGF